MSMPTPDADEIIIDGWRFKVVGGVVNVQNLATFQRKTVIGDYTRDSNPVLSTWVLTDFSGGHGVQALEEGADAARYRFGVVDARRPRQITCPPLTVSIDSPNTEDAFPLGQISRATAFYVAFGVSIYAWNETTDAFADTADDLTLAPTTKPVSFNGKLWIANGTSFDDYDGATVTNHADFAAQAFCVWDRRMFGLATNGQLWETFDGTTWTNIGAEAKINDGSLMRHIVAFYDRSDFPMPVVITDQDVWAFDPSGPALYRTDVQYPGHRDQGLGSAVWRGELYTSVGMGVFRYNGSTLSAMGLDRDQGLPAEIRGKVVDLLNEYNGLYALVSGAENLTPATEPETFDAVDDEWYVSTATAVSSLHIYTAYGWHCYWTSEGATGLPSWMAISSVNDTYRLWWGVGATMQTMTLPIDFANARAQIDAGVGSFAESAYLDTGEFDAGLTSYTKIANAILIRAKASSSATITVAYRTSSNAGFTTLGTVSSTGETQLLFGTEADGIIPGMSFKTIEFRFTFTRTPGDVSAAPILESAVFSYLKLIPAYHSYVAKIDLQYPYAGKSQDQMNAKLEELIAADRFFAMQYRDVKYRVRIAQGGGADLVGRGDSRSDRTINLLEIAEGL